MDERREGERRGKKGKEKIKGERKKGRGGRGVGRWEVPPGQGGACGPPQGPEASLRASLLQMGTSQGA